MTTNSENPASKYLGTTWQKIEGRFLLGTSGSGASKATGGSNQKTITQANLPNVKLKVDSFSLSISPHTHDINGICFNNRYYSGGGAGYFGSGGYIRSTENGGGTTGTATPSTQALGSGQALDITPSYYTCHMWLRLS